MPRHGVAWRSRGLASTPLSFRHELMRTLQLLSRLCALVVSSSARDSVSLLKLAPAFCNKVIGCTSPLLATVPTAPASPTSWIALVYNSTFTSPERPHPKRRAPISHKPTSSAFPP